MVIDNKNRKRREEKEEKKNKRKVWNQELESPRFYLKPPSSLSTRGEF